MVHADTGTPIWGVSVKVVDEYGAELPPGTDNAGEIVIRGHNVMKGCHEIGEVSFDHPPLPRLR